MFKAVLIVAFVALIQGSFAEGPPSCPSCSAGCQTAFAKAAANCMSNWDCDSVCVEEVKKAATACSGDDAKLKADNGGMNPITDMVTKQSTCGSYACASCSATCKTKLTSITTGCAGSASFSSGPGYVKLCSDACKTALTGFATACPAEDAAKIGEPAKRIQDRVTEMEKADFATKCKVASGTYECATCAAACKTNLASTSTSCAGSGLGSEAEARKLCVAACSTALKGFGTACPAEDVAKLDLYTSSAIQGRVAIATNPNFVTACNSAYATANFSAALMAILAVIALAFNSSL